eukprot:6204886-Pleurochrysis_carterae.AAC.1
MLSALLTNGTVISSDSTLSRTKKWRLSMCSGGVQDYRPSRWHSCCPSREEWAEPGVDLARRRARVDEQPLSPLRRPQRFRLRRRRAPRWPASLRTRKWRLARA